MPAMKGHVEENNRQHFASDVIGRWDMICVGLSCWPILFLEISSTMMITISNTIIRKRKTSISFPHFMGSGPVAF